MVAHQMNRNRIIIPVLSLLLIICASTAGAKVVATVDRTGIVVDETLTLTITMEGSSFFTDPDLEPLQKDFKVLGQSQQSRTRIINGTASSSVSWTITLAPRRAGTLEIPPLSVGKDKTAPLAVQVSAATAPKTRGDNVPIFIETEVDEHSVVVQSQLIYTLRVYWATEIQIIDPGAPNIADALLQQLDDATFEKVIDGSTYRVFERNYAIFPQKSGVMEIPQMIVQINIPSRTSHRNLFDPFGSRGEIIKLRSEGEQVTVREKPPEYPASAVWLPSAGLIIKDEWSQSPTELNVGESATLSLSIIADGLMAEQLPPVDLVEPEGVKLYQGRAEVENIATAAGIVGTRKESIALIPTRPGEMELPEIRIPWWDKKNRKVEYAVIPAIQLTVRGTASQPAGLSSGDVREKTVQVVPAPSAVQQPLPRTSLDKAVIVLCIVLAAAWLITLCLLFHARRQLKEHSQFRMKNLEHEKAVKEREAFAAVAGACKANDAVEARAAIMSWAQAFQPKEKIRTFADITRTVADSELVSLLREIDSALYSPGQSVGQWQGAKLLQEVTRIRKGRMGKRTMPEPLQQLYK
jgi:hypothetical protein